MDTPSKLERLKRDSDFLRGDLDDEVRSARPAVSDDGKQLLKFHGLYQQDDRDLRPLLRLGRTPRRYTFMVRTRLPGGRLTAEQYLAHDALARRYGNGTLRITTRQDFQFHGILRGDIPATLQALDREMTTTLGACGDVVRNVMCCPVPAAGGLRRRIARLVDALARRFSPHTGAYHELWLDGRRTGMTTESEEPLYGRTYLPRKFKIGVAYPGDNCIDVHTQDVGLVPVVAGRRLLGFNVLVGGGLGMTHNKPRTFPRLASPLAFVRPDRAVDTVEQIVCIQRDHGDRSDRRHARLKYLIHDRGLEWFGALLADRLGYRPAPARPLPALDLDLHLGWHAQGDGTWYLGVPVENGRLRDQPGCARLSALRTIVERHRPQVILTPQQDLLLAGLEEDRRPEIDALLLDHGCAPAGELTELHLHAMACPALPTCGLALAEAERALPTLIRDLERVLSDLGLAGEKLSVRMTGCPNGCARPYVADLAFVGRSADRYLILVGGRTAGNRLNRPFLDLVERDNLVAAVTPLFRYFQESRKQGESFGDFCDRIGVDALRKRGEPSLGKPSRQDRISPGVAAHD